MREFHDIPYGENPSQKLDIYLPEADTFDVFLYFHGGGLTKGSKSSASASHQKYLTDCGIAFVSADYRLFPEAKYPDFITDAAVCSDWVLENLPKYGNCRRFFLGGSSAGGYLSMMLCFDSRRLEAVGRSPDDFAGFIHDAGQPTAHYQCLEERGLDKRRVIVDESAPFIMSDFAGNILPCCLLSVTMICRTVMSRPSL